MSVEMSMDKVSITAKVMAGVDDSLLFDFLQHPAVGAEYFYSSKNFMYQHNYKLPCGSFFQFGKSQGEENARLEWNPNKCNQQTIDRIIKRLKYPKVTRIDWAVDYHGVDLTDIQVRDLGSRGEIEYKRRNKKRNALYVGMPTSDNFIRIYDKELEQRQGRTKSEDDLTVSVGPRRLWWRIEAVVKDFSMIVEKELMSVIEVNGKEMKRLKKEKVKTDGYLFDNPFRKIELYEKAELGDDGLKMQEKAMLFYLMHNPDEWDKLCTNTRKKYEDLRYAMGHILMLDQPWEVFEKEKSRLANELESVLRPAMDDGKYLIGHVTNIEYSLDYLNNPEKYNNTELKTG